jgi:hypothetical protein
LFVETILASFAVSGIVTLIRASRRFTRDDWRGVVALGALTLIAAVFHSWLLFKYSAVCESLPRRLGEPSGWGWRIVGATFRASVAPLAAVLVRQKGGRWHHALVAAVLIAFFPPEGVEGIELPWLLAGFIGFVEARREPHWSHVALTVIGLAIAAMCCFGTIYASPWPAIILAVVFATLLLPGRSFGRWLWIGRAMGAALVLAVVPLAVVHSLQDLRRPELFTHRMHDAMLIRDVPECTMLP